MTVLAVRPAGGTFLEMGAQSSGACDLAQVAAAKGRFAAVPGTGSVPTRKAQRAGREAKSLD